MGSLIQDLEEITENKNHGSSFILKQIITLLNSKFFNRDELNLIFKNLSSIDKSMILIHHFLDSLKPYIDRGFYNSLSEYQSSWHNTEAQIAENLYGEISTSILISSVFLTHSHSGVLIKVLEILFNRGLEFEVIQTVSMPGGEGKLQAETLEKLGIKVKLLKDDNLNYLLDRVNVCLLGVDQYDNCGFINKVGSNKLIKYSNRLNIPVYILGDSRKKVSVCKISNSKMFEYTDFNKNTKVISEKFD